MRTKKEVDWFSQESKFNLSLTAHELRVLELWCQRHGRVSKAAALRNLISQLEKELLESKVLASRESLQGFTAEQKQSYNKWLADRGQSKT